MKKILVFVFLVIFFKLNLNSQNVVIASQTICNGSTALLTGSTTLTGATATIVPGGQLSIGNNISFTVSPASSTTYTVTLQGTNALNSPVTFTTVTTVNVLTPTVSINTSSTVCEGSSVNLYANANSNGTITYSWVGPNGFTSSLQHPVLSNINPISSGIYSVQATCASGTLVCNSGNSTSLTIIPVPQVTVVPTTTAICQDENLNLFSGAPGASSYHWSGPFSFTSSSQNTGLTSVNLGMAGIYTLTATFTANNVTCISTNTIDVTVRPKMNFTLTPIPNVCDDTSLLIPGPVGATSYSWNGPNNYSSFTKDLTIKNVNTTQSGLYKLTLELNGCKMQDSVYVNVLSPVTYSIIPKDTSICKNDTLNFYTLPVGGSGAYNITWSPLSAILGTNGNNAISAPTVSTSYTITVNDIACPTQSINTTFEVSVNPLPVPNVSASKLEGCAPLCIDLSSNLTPKAVDVLWNFGGNISIVGDDINFCFVSPGTFSICLIATDINGCESKNIVPFTIKVYPLPISDFIWDPFEATLIDNNLQFKSSYVNGPIISYNWNFGDVHNKTFDSSSVKNPKHEYFQSGYYPVTLIETNSYGCSDTIIKTVKVADDFNLYVPNAFSPNGDGFNDVFLPKGMGFKPESFEMMIFDRWGNLIFRTTDCTKGWEGTYKGTNAKSDVYIVKIKCTISNGSACKEKVSYVTLIR